MTLRVGIDEAGYGPTLGPLVVAAACVDTPDPTRLAAELAAHGVADSKRVHRSGDLAALERVALPAAAWLSGFVPDTADDLFALLAEGCGERSPNPWMAGAEDLRLPLRAGTLQPWNITAATPGGLHGRIRHPAHLNAAKRSGVNRAAAELAVVRELLIAAVPDPLQPGCVACDRLGGRTRYSELLASAWPAHPPTILTEGSPACRYQCAATEVAFLVGGESAEILVAVASCIAKYVRELHMHLFNQHWCSRFPWLAPTAGYPEDAKRWLHQLGSGTVDAWRDALVRR